VRITVKPPIIPAGREQHKAGNKGGGGGKKRGVLAQGRPDMTGFRVISRDGEEKRKICVELGYDVQGTE